MTDMMNRAVREVLTTLDDDDCKTGVCAIAAGVMHRNGYDIDERSVAAGVTAAFAKFQQDLYVVLGADIMSSPVVDAFADESTDDENSCLTQEGPCDDCADEQPGSLLDVLLAALAAGVDDKD